MNVQLCSGIIKRLNKIEVRGGGIMIVMTIQHMEKYFSTKNQKVEQRFDYINCKVFGKTAEILATKSEGDFILAQGKCITGNYENKEGKKVYTQDFEVLFVDFPAEAERNYHERASGNNAGKSYADEAPSQGTFSPGYNSAAEQQPMDGFGKIPGQDTDLPF